MEALQAEYEAMQKQAMLQHQRAMREMKLEDERGDSLLYDKVLPAILIFTMVLILSQGFIYMLCASEGYSDGTGYPILDKMKKRPLIFSQSEYLAPAF